MKRLVIVEVDDRTCLTDEERWGGSRSLTVDDLMAIVREGGVGRYSGTGDGESSSGFGR